MPRDIINIIANYIVFDGKNLGDFSKYVQLGINIDDTPIGRYLKSAEEYQMYHRIIDQNLFEILDYLASRSELKTFRRLCYSNDNFHYHLSIEMYKVLMKHNIKLRISNYFMIYNYRDIEFMSYFIEISTELDWYRYLIKPHSRYVLCKFLQKGYKIKIDDFDNLYKHDPVFLEAISEGTVEFANKYIANSRCLKCKKITEDKYHDRKLCESCFLAGLAAKFGLKL